MGSAEQSGLALFLENLTTEEAQTELMFSPNLVFFTHDFDRFMDRYIDKACANPPDKLKPWQSKAAWHDSQSSWQSWNQPQWDYPPSAGWQGVHWGTKAKSHGVQLFCLHGKVSPLWVLC